MQVIHYKKELQDVLLSKDYKNCTIGFVPTMGALHGGHISLVERAVKENDIATVSIFINPTQFDKREDLEKYPADLEKDISLLKKVSNKILIFAPSASEIYSGNITSKEFNFNGLEKVMEGEFRPGHFNGVATIVELFLLTVKPTRAYFGEKDFQQLQIIRKLVELKKFPFKIIGCPIEREPNGLARSSRNERLSNSARGNAGFIYETLKSAKAKFGTESAKVILEFVETEFENNEIFELEYFQIADVETLTPIIKKQENIKYRAFIAVYAEGIRLIDNIAL
ncbi:pantoate--beta-alanine ligase [Croceitalea sp. MTPC9]|uniref:pantoate--beta-alanine ligase n=1 Tax=unclassified Croceitalea TaxID=2632280 RepID=UPI002B3FDF65|nr:pantoate--beta-alanine ligase [Croceitalea sp. MTPC6]GMN16855.1 pantoate--beta-alanine ligase [Croceitalea sp. MTPC9]